MSVARFPVLLWQPAEGTCAACLIGRHETFSAVGRSSQDAVRQLREFLSWRDKRERGVESPELSDLELQRVKVDVRPEYSLGARVVPCAELLTLHLAVVTGKLGELTSVHVPRLDLSFYLYPGQSLSELVRHFAQQKLQGHSPRQLARALPPSSFELLDLAVQVRDAKRRPGDERQALLRSVADPVGDSNLRRLLGPARGREAEVKSLARILGTESANVLIVGESGAGKTTALVEAVRQVERARRERLELRGDAGYQHWQTSGARLIAGMPYLGQWEERLEEVIDALANTEGVLCLGNLLEALLAGGFGPRDGIVSFLVPFVEEGELRLVAEASPSEVAACRRHLPGVLELFHVVHLQELARPACLRVLGQVADAQGRHLKLERERGAVETVERLFRRFSPYHPFPGRAAGFLRRCYEDAAREGAGELTTQRVVEAFVRRTGLPERLLRDDVLLEREALVASLEGRVIGQPQACAAAADLLLTFKAGLNDPQRPLGVLLLCGPTGVGKTALARLLAETLFAGASELERDEAQPSAAEREERLIRLDMSEYTGPFAVDRLLGSAGGQPGELVEKIRRQPFSVVLLDEVEKADPRVFDVLMGVFDEGRLTDAFGRLTTFRSAVIVLTSNLGAASQTSLGFAEGAAATYEDEARRFFRPEFYNRIDRVVSFAPLSSAVVREIAAKELAGLTQREGLARHGLSLSWSEAVLDLLVAEGFDPRYGARPLQRALEEHVVTALAQFLVEARVATESSVRLDLEGGRVVARAGG